jgi:phosphatidylserine/phosphatidylglycerophosphate/cardiolipin synthase-like enzyme
MEKLVLFTLIGILSCAETPLTAPPDSSAPLQDAAADAAADAMDDADTADAEAARAGLELTAPKMVVHFSPKGGCTDAIVQLILSAKVEVLVQAYSFTSRPIANALVQQSKKVSVKVILDSDGKQNAIGGAVLVQGGVSTWSDPKHVIAHNKVIVVDGKTVETGSFNYTAQAENGNAENCLIVRDAALAGQYASSWALHQAHSVPYVLSVNDAGASEAGVADRWK